MYRVLITVAVMLMAVCPILSYAEPQEGKFSQAGIDDEQEARDFFVFFQRAVVNHEKTKVADMVCYPVGASLASGKHVVIKSKKDLLQKYDAIFDTVFVDAIGKKTPDELWSNYNGVATSGGELWFHKLWHNSCKGAVLVSEINNETERSMKYAQQKAVKELANEAKKGRKIESGGTVTPEPVQKPADNIQGYTSSDSVSMIRKRVEKENKITSKRVYAKKPKLPSNLTEQAAVMQLALNTKSIVPDKGYVAECFFNGTGSSYREHIYCNMYFPGNYPVGGVPMSYVHYIESVASNVTQSFKKGATWSFDISALVNVENGYTPVCRFIYDKEFDLVTPIYSVR